MVLLMIVLLVFFLLLAIFLLFKFGAWAMKTNVRMLSLLIFLVVLGAGGIIYYHSFNNMALIQSNVYSQLYLVKNRDMNDTLVHQAIKEKVREIMNVDPNIKNNTPVDAAQYTLRFYEYTTGDWGEAGTAYFVDHEERVDGMMAELLEYYPNDLIAETSTVPCAHNSAHFKVLVHYFKKRRQIKTDTLFNPCEQ